jgi:hypothetical protein
VKITRFKELLLVGLGHIAAGIFFGTGCIIVEHADNTWWHPETAVPGEATSIRKVAHTKTVELNDDEPVASK